MLEMPEKKKTRAFGVTHLRALDIHVPRALVSPMDTIIRTWQVFYYLLVISIHTVAPPLGRS